MDDPTRSCDFDALDHEPHAAARRSGAPRIACEPAFDFESAEYRALFEASDTDVFRHPLWLSALYRRLAPHRGATPVVVTVRAGTGRLLALLPMTLRRKGGVRLLEAAHLGVSDYAAPVIREDWREALQGFDPAAGTSAALPAHDVLRIEPVRPERLADWASFFPARPRALPFSAHAAAPTSPYAAWRAENLTASTRRMLDRRRKRFAKEGAVTLTRLPPQEAEQAIALLRRLREGRFAGDPIQDPAVEGFYAEIAERGSADGFVRLYRLAQDGVPVGTVFAPTHRGRLYYLLIGCDYAGFGRHSPGLVMFDMMMEDWAEAGGTVFDFTIGDEPFKADFGTRATPMHAIVEPRTLRGRLGLLALEGRAAIGSLQMRMKAGNGEREA